MQGLDIRGAAKASDDGSGLDESDPIEHDDSGQEEPHDDSGQEEAPEISLGSGLPPPKQKWVNNSVGLYNLLFFHCKLQNV